jgi:hypothetical protein
MSQMQSGTIQLIVENAMRKNGYSGGAMEDAWKDVITTPDGTKVDIPVNLQNLRDSITQAIFDSLTTVTAKGIPTVLSIPGKQIIEHVNTDISIFATSYPPTPSTTVFPFVPPTPNFPLLLSNINLNYDPEYYPMTPIKTLPVPLQSTKGAARLGDSTQINVLTDPIFISLWVTVLNALYVADTSPVPIFGGTMAAAIILYYGGPPTPFNVQVSGIIAGASSTVHIGD